MAEDEWSLKVHDAYTGAPVRSVTSVDSKWSTSLAGDGVSTETIVVNDAENPWPHGDVANLFRPKARIIARWWGGSPLYAHLIEDWDYDKDAGTVTVEAADLLGEADWRMVDGVGADKYSTLTVTRRTPSGAIAAALARMMQWGWEWQYPIDLPADAPGEIDGSWPFWKKHRISDIIKQIEDRAGVETYLRPYATADGGIRFQTRVGGPITIGSTLLHLDADETPIAGVRYRVDGKKQITGLLGVGNGSGEDQETAWRGGIIRIPIRDIKESFPDLTGDALGQATEQYYLRNVDPVTQWSIGSYTIGDGYPPELAAPGRLWQVNSVGDPVIPDGVHPIRVIKASGTNGRQIQTEVQSAAA
ncbi:hypothetical protein [Microbacterium sp. IEGM 1404]|uniref:hypothetical protein n=1 Tax=Microbacterium sp. IEGM 1404 TaxID=3047084 RepID=UPI0024B6AE4C|nr:hypothetical protein [Microbacterium sp. IEGM 1404]MDI9889979.1 hypothetical protein [Microbacterium sp. IEGM 1404]